MKYLLLIGCMWCSVCLPAQQQRTLHQTFDLSDITSVVFDLFGSYQVEPWPGSALLVETTVEMWEENKLGPIDAPLSIFQHFVDKGRYQLQGTLLQKTQLRIQSKDMARPAIRSQQGYFTEKTSVRILLPENYFQTGDHTWSSQ
jgi:hypothetical protein